MARGHTLLELTLVLAVGAIAAAVLAPPARTLSDRLAVTAAREAVAGLLAEARVVAMERGGASVHLADGPWRAWSVADGEVVRTIQLERETGVLVELGGGRREVSLDFDALGLGVVASRTLIFRRGDAEARLVVSGYGRIRRR